MANLRELRRRIRSVTNTAQITRAMQMVAATKMRRAQAQALSARPYDETIIASLNRLLESDDELDHPLLHEGSGKDSCLILLSTDKSLCGSLNTNLFRAVQSFFEQQTWAQFITVGKKGRDFVARTGKNLVADFSNPEKISFSSARQVAKLALELFLDHKIKALYLAYPQFISTLRQQPQVVKLLPIERTQLTKDPPPPQAILSDGLFLFEPNTYLLLDFVLTHYLEARIYQAMLEAKASEHSARMIAMQNATDNAKDLVEDLKLTYNQTRQGAITAELLDITSAGFAFE